MDLQSQDVGLEELRGFRKAVMSTAGGKAGKPEELIMFSAESRPYQYDSLDSMVEELPSLPEGASYLYYTIRFRKLGRCSLYLDPDRPGKVVIEGDEGWMERVSRAVSDGMGKGDPRHVVHSRAGVFIIWGIIVSVAILALTITTLAMGGADPILTAVIIFMSGMLGIYLSLVKMKEIQPANRISFSGSSRWWVESLLHLVTIALGIICAIMGAVLVKEILDLL